MKYTFWRSQGWANAQLLFSLIILGCLVPLTAKAQVTPDGTTATTVNQNGDNFTIEQGDRVGDNLFHSFNEFSVPTMGSAAFNNAGDIANIFSRVTGSSISSIDGLLGANGTANLFLINPNGIIFGENASLNLGGSFFASTADSLLFEGDAEFSAVNPQAPPLLEVNIPIGANFRDNPGDIVNQGNLAVEQDFTLSGGNLDLQGQLQAGGNLTLQATDTVRIRDTINNPFIAAANGKLLVQGNQSVYIFALNHPNSGLFSGGDLVLRSANAVSGDAHYSTGGNFKIEQLDGNLGSLFSFYDPILRANGNVSLNNYMGTSLHILAGGSVTIPGDVIITGSDETGNTINPDTTLALANVTLSDGTALVIDGTAQPTLDVRAGVNQDVIGEPLGLVGNNFVPFDGTIDGLPDNADINIGVININQPDGLVFLTNQYLPNTSLPESNIQVGTILTGDLALDFAGNGGAVLVDSRNNFIVGNGINTSSEFGNAGNINLIADNEISLDNSLIVSSTLGDERGGDISVKAKSISLMNNAQIAANTLGEGSGGNINIDTDLLQVQDSIITLGTSGLGNTGNLSLTASDSIQINGDFVNSDGSIAPSGLSTDVQGNGDAGNLTIETNNLIVTDGAQISASNEGMGKGGNISIQANSVDITEESKTSGFSSGIFAPTNGDGNGGNITITTESLTASEGGQIIAQAKQGLGNAGDIAIETNILTLESNSIISAATLSSGQGGNLNIDTERLLIQDSAISANILGSGTGGNLSIIASDLIELNGDFINSDSSIVPSGLFIEALGNGNAGSLTVNTDNLIVTDGAQISASTERVGKGSNITIQANSIELTGESTASGANSGIFVPTNGDGDAGNLTIETNNLMITDSARISASTRGAGKGGNISIQANSIELTGKSTASGANTGIFASTNGDGDAGDITITTESLTASEGGVIVAEAQQGLGNAGDIAIDSNVVTFRSDSAISAGTASSGQGGNLTIDTDNLIITDGAELTTSTLASGDGGNLNISASEITLEGFSSVNDSLTGLFSQAGGAGSAGDVTVNTEQLIVRDRAQISTSTTSSEEGAGGKLSIETNKLSVLDGGQIIAATINNGQAGTIEITATDFIELIGTDMKADGSQTQSILANQTRGTGNAQDINITTSSLIVKDGAGISSSTFAEGEGGTINIDADTIELSGSKQGTLIEASSEMEASGNAGQITIETEQLSIKNGASIFAGTDGEGKAGNINISAFDIEVTGTSEDGQSDSSIGAQVNRGGIGEGGNLTIDATNFTVSNGAQVSVATLDKGNAGILTINTERLVVENAQILGATTIDSTGQGGTINITASDSIQLSGKFINPDGSDSFSGLSVQTDGSQSAGNINIIDTDRLILIDGGQIVASTNGDGNGGNININAEKIEFVGGSLTTDQIDSGVFNTGINASTIGTGQGGNVTISGDSLSIQSGTAITTQGNAGVGGDININIEDIDLQGGAISASTTGERNAGNVTINTENLTLEEGAQISALTSGSGQAGTLKIDASNSIRLTGKRNFRTVSSITTAGDNGGTAGSLTLTTGELTVADGAAVTVNSQSGLAGNLNITANSLFQNRGSITAETGLSEGDIGANINLEISELWRIENESLVSASALGDADGGNININTDPNLSNTELVLLAFPPTGANGSDIIANSDRGDGGRIDIRAAGVFGIEFRDEQTPLNDFTVTSEFGQSGETIINRTVEDPTSGLIELPQAVGDASDQISQNPCEQGVGSEFIVTGKGGLPPNVNESLNSEEAQVGLIEAVPSGRRGDRVTGGQGDRETRRQGDKAKQSDNLATEAMPAMGWVFNDQGEVTLTAYKTTDTEIQRSGEQYSSTCKSGIAP